MRTSQPLILDVSPAGMQRPPPARRRWYRRPVVLTLLILVAVLLALWAASDTIARSYTRRAFASMQQFDGLLTTAHVSLPKLSYSFQDLKIVEKLPEEGDAPLFYGKEVTARLRWRDLIRGHWWPPRRSCAPSPCGS
jgi:hypothetical protein